MISILLALIVLSSAQVSHDLLPLQIESVHFAPVIKTVPSSIAFKTIFPALGYEIGGQVYETH
jgi:hypothetical protein